MDSSGTIRVKQGHNPDTNMHIKSMKDGDANSEPLTYFSCAEDGVRNDISLLSTVAGRHSAEPVEERDMIAKGEVWSMSTDKILGGSKLEIEDKSVKKYHGLAETDDKVLKFFPGYFKKLKSGIEHATIGEEKGDGSVYLLKRSNLILRAPKKCYASDERSNIMQERTIDDGCSKLVTSSDDELVKIFTFQFAKAKQPFSFPFHTELPSYCIVISWKKTLKKVSLEISVKVIEVWLRAVLTGLVSIVTPGASRASFDFCLTAETLTEVTSRGRQLLEDGNDLVCDAYKSSATKKKSEVTLFVKGTIPESVDRAKHRNTGKEELERLNDRRYYETILEFFELQYPDKKHSQKHSIAGALLQRKIKMMDEECDDSVVYQAPERHRNGNGQELAIRPAVDQASRSNGYSNGQDPALRTAVNQQEAKKTFVRLKAAEEVGKASARLKRLIVCLVLVILTIVSIYDHHNGVDEDNINDQYGEEPGTEMTLQKSLSIILFKRFMRLGPMEQPATEAFRVFFRALNGLSHCPPAFDQYCNATRQQ